jgi:3-hydroxybutyryl-CoA dehydratase
MYESRTIKEQQMTDTKELRVRSSMYFEEFEVGQSITSVGRTITEADIVNFAGLTGDWTQMHTNAEYAARHPFGQRVAHGLLGLSIASAMAVRLGFVEDTVLAFREISEWKFSLPIFIGDTIHMRAIVTDTKAMRRLGGGLVTFKVEILNQRDEVVQRGTWGLLVMSCGE